MFMGAKRKFGFSIVKHGDPLYFDYAYCMKTVRASTSGQVASVANPIAMTHLETAYESHARGMFSLDVQKPAF